jgi:hypothetical protein
VYKIVTPNVVKAAQTQFGCNSMVNPGAGGDCSLQCASIFPQSEFFFFFLNIVHPELEDGGGSGTALSHWETRLFRNEIMTGATSGDAVISPITLALFADMGWYQVVSDHSAVGELLWGK